MYLLSGWGQRTVEMRRFDSDGSDEGHVSSSHWVFDCDIRACGGDLVLPALPGISVIACVIGLLDQLWAQEVRDGLCPPEGKP
jgi:hypothetical protein